MEQCRQQARYDIHGIAGLNDQSRKPHSVMKVKVTEELEKTLGH